MLAKMVAEWRHVFKLDPQKTISDENLERICQSGTDGIIVGGTDGVTFDNVIELLGRVRRFALPCVQEVSNRAAIVPGFDGYLIPMILNAVDVQWVVGAQHEAVREFGGMIPWSDVLGEGYVVLNPDSRVAKTTSSRTDLAPEDVTAYAEMADRLLHLSILYIEYSGTYGNTETVQAAKKSLANAQLFYGGGIDTLARAREMASIADTIVVGNAVYDNVQQAVRTVKAVK